MWDAGSVKGDHVERYGGRRLARTARQSSPFVDTPQRQRFTEGHVRVASPALGVCGERRSTISPACVPSPRRYEARAGVAPESGKTKKTATTSLSSPLPASQRPPRARARQARTYERRYRLHTTAISLHVLMRAWSIAGNESHANGERCR